MQRIVPAGTHIVPAEIPPQTSHLDTNDRVGLRIEVAGPTEHIDSDGIGFQPIGPRPLLAYSVASTLLGAQALTLGLLAELLVAYTGRESDLYSVAEQTPASRGATASGRN